VTGARKTNPFFEDLHDSVQRQSSPSRRRTMPELLDDFSNSLFDGIGAESTRSSGTGHTDSMPIVRGRRSLSASLELHSDPLADHGNSIENRLAALANARKRDRVAAAESTESGKTQPDCRPSIRGAAGGRPTAKEIASAAHPLAWIACANLSMPVYIRKSDMRRRLQFMSCARTRPSRANRLMHGRVDLIADLASHEYDSRPEGVGARRSATKSRW